MTAELPHLRLNNQLAFAVHVSVWVAEMGIPAADVGQMIAAAQASARAWERNDSKAEQKWSGVVEQIAEQHGCVVDWPGLWPSIQKKDDPRSNRPLPSPY